jgi:hypothetical protein
MESVLMQASQEFDARRPVTTRVVGRQRPMTFRPAKGGVLKVASGTVWLTQTGGTGDWVLQTGESHHLRAGQLAVIEDWGGAVPASFDWQPGGASAQPLGLDFGLRLLAAGADEVARRLGRLAAWARARSAASSAMRPQGCI